jgi:hypothetical protein
MEPASEIVLKAPALNLAIVAEKWRTSLPDADEYGHWRG